MLAALVKEGHELVDEPNGAEAIVINTCAFIEDAKREAIDTVLEMAEFKKKGSCKLLVVAGCLPQRYEGELAELLPEVDIFIGTGDFHKIVDLIKSWSGTQHIEVGKPEYIYDHRTERLHTTARHIAYLKISEGCFHPCSFCIIPKLRGKFRSRPIESILDEAQRMLSDGVKEINLIAQDTTAYGVDIGTDFAKLLRSLSDLKGGDKWLRILYAYPHKFSDEVIELMRDRNDICSYIDLPIQHINDRILKMMKRKGEGREIRTLLRKLRERVPGVSIRTSLIVGFPGETQKEFDELLDFMSDIRFEHLGVFTFSPEDGTPAAKLKERVHPKIAEDRMNEAMELQREISLSNNQRYLGRRIEVLVEGPSEETEMLIQARHEGQAPEFDGVVYINEGFARPGSFVTVNITETHHYDLVGRVVD